MDTSHSLGFGKMSSRPGVADKTDTGDQSAEDSGPAACPVASWPAPYMESSFTQKGPKAQIGIGPKL